jgi:amino acid adenylation domain-containing protein
VVRRHEILRTTFAQVDQEIVQAVHDQLTIQIPFLDLSKLEKQQREQEANRTAVTAARRLFDLGSGPLIRACLVKMEPEYHRLYVTLHHIIFDGVALDQVLLPELAAIYSAFAAGEDSPLPEPRYQYADFALWEKRMLANASVERQTSYWRGQLAGELPELQLPTDRPRPAVYSYRGSMKAFALSADLTAAIKAASRAEGVTPYMFLLAAFKTLLHRYSGQRDILVGGVSDMRRRPEFEKMMGLFLNFLALRTHPSGEMTFREYLAQVKDTVLGALANSDEPFDRLIRDLELKRESTRRPFFQATLSMKPAGTAVIDPQWDLTQMDTATGFTKLDLYLEIDERPGSMNARFVYSTDLFNDETIDRMTGHWLTLLKSAADHPAARLCDLTMLPADEEHQLRAGWNETDRQIPPQTVHELIEQQVAHTPHAIAVEAAGVRLTYTELNERANRLADRLRSAGVTQGSLVALCVERTVDLAIAPLAVWKAGGAYLPLDPGFPKDRLEYLMEDAQAPLLLATRSLIGQLPAAAQTMFCDETQDEEGAEKHMCTAPCCAEDRAYVRYTSGSTGRPKGVEIHHRALVNLLLSIQREPGFSASDALLAVTTFSFDIAELELYLPLISGGRLVIASREDARDPRRLRERLHESKCNVLQATPAAWGGLIDAGWPGQQNLRAFCGGEALTRDLAEQLLPRVAELWNLYGPTETTVWSAVHRVASGAGPVPIGHPIDNTDIYILDAHLKLAPIGASGELYIGGAGVARGYLRREELTEERFLPHPFKTNQRLYRSGDLARRMPDGTIECMGRVDNQIKIRGFRIELGEIEAALLEHDDVRAAAVRAWPDASGNLSIAAYIAGSPDGDLRRFLAQKLPDYMIPARFVTLDALPLTPNGKLDRNALPEPSGAGKDITIPAVAPRNEAERKLAAIWESVLAVGTQADARPIGIDDNFFDLGGHSFLVAKLLRKIEAEFGQRLSMAAVFQAPTISSLAELLADASSMSRMPGTINLQPKGAREPLFWIDGGPLFRPLAMHLDINRPFLGVDLESSDQNSSHLSFPEFAAELVSTIRNAQPHGPYHIGGWCISGLLAYEVASQLMEAGQEVALVVMLDAVNPAHYCAIPKVRMIASKTAFHLRQMLHASIGGFFSYTLKRMQGFLRAAFNRAPEQATAFDLALLAAAVAYRPGPVQARVLAIQPAARPQVRDMEQSWAEHLKQGNIEVRDVPGDHLTMFEEPHVIALAKCIKNSLRDNVVVIRRAS